MESTDIFHIGRYELFSAGSRSGFFNGGVKKYPDLKTAGMAPRRSNLLKSSTKNGASKSTYSRSFLMGIVDWTHTAYSS